MWQNGTAGAAPREMLGQQMSDHLTEQMPEFWGGSINGDAEGCKPSAYGTPDSISGHPTIYVFPI